MAERTPRFVETREQASSVARWRPSSDMGNIPPDPVFDFRWVRMSITGSLDEVNISKKKQEGYEMVKAEDYPAIAANYGTSERDNMRGAITNGDLVLFKFPKAFAQQKRDYYANMAKNSIVGVDNNLMKENDPRMPLFRHRDTKVSFGSGS